MQLQLQLFSSLLGFLKNLGFLVFWIFIGVLDSGFLTFLSLLNFWLYLGNKKSYWSSAGVKKTEVFKAFFKYKIYLFWIYRFLDFFHWIFENEKNYGRYEQQWSLEIFIIQKCLSGTGKCRRGALMKGDDALFKIDLGDF